MEIVFLTVAFVATITALVARNNGRNVWIAACLGAVFGLLATIGYLIAGKTTLKKAQELKDVRELLKE